MLLVYLPLIPLCRYDFRRNAPKQVDREELRQMGINVKNKEDVTLETEYEKIKGVSIQARAFLG